MGYAKYRVRLNQKRKDAISELMAIGYDRNEAVEILDTHSLLMSKRDKELLGLDKRSKVIEDGDY